MEEKIIKVLLKLIKKAYKKNEVPIGCVLVKNNKIVSRAYNKKNIKQNSLFHAEIICLQKAYKKLKRWNLNDCILYVSLEPCDMCKKVIEESRIQKVYYLLKKGRITNTFNKTQYEQMYSIHKNDCEKYVKNFFVNLRKN